VKTQVPNKSLTPFFIHVYWSNTKLVVVVSKVP
jgi:hypothetical protein